MTTDPDPEAGTDTVPGAVPAATLVLMRERDGAPPELLMVERAATMAFAAGAMVFPGGRVDPADELLAATHGGTLDDAASRIAAIRETLEETGIAVAIDPLPDADRVAAMRAGLHAGEPLSAVLGTARLSLDTLVPFARWLPNHPEVRVFDTHFYLARAPAGTGEPRVDATENAVARWVAAADLLAQAAADEARIIFPTRRNLERLARFADFAAARADALVHPVRTITPWREIRDGVAWLCIPDDAGYPVTAERFAEAMRR